MFGHGKDLVGPKVVLEHRDLGRGLPAPGLDRRSVALLPGVPYMLPRSAEIRLSPPSLPGPWSGIFAMNIAGRLQRRLPVEESSGGG